MVSAKLSTYAKETLVLVTTLNKLLKERPPLAVSSRPHNLLLVIRKAACWTPPFCVILLRHVHYVMPAPNTYL
jgi:hypothetical protein